MGSTGSSGSVGSGSLDVSEEELDELSGSEYSLDELDVSGGSELSGGSALSEELSVEYSLLSGSLVSDVSYATLMLSVEVLEELDALSPTPLLEDVTLLEELPNELETDE